MSSVADEKQKEIHIESPAALSKPWIEFAIFSSIALVGFVIFWNANPSSVPPRTTMYFDAAHYLETCKRLYDCCSTFLLGKLTSGHLDALAYYLLLDGPVLPGCGAILFGMLHKVPDLNQWQVLVGMQCFFQALCSGFVYLLSKNILKSRWAAMLAALAWATYPSAISSCNSYLTEPLTCLLSVAFIYFLTGMNNSRIDLLSYSKCFLSGSTLALLALLKPALAPAACVVFLISLCSSAWDTLKTWRANQSSFKRATWLASGRSLIAIAGISLIFGPWFAFSYAARGTITVLPSRKPVYNIATGCNIEGDGWGCYPTHPIAQMYDDNEAAMPVMLALIQGHPPEIANLTLRKISRLWTLPWNDYRYKILGLNYRLQSIYQLLLMIFGISGMLALAASCCDRQTNNIQKLTIASVCVLILGHLIYLPFEGIARYGFTAMPLIVICAAAMLEFLTEQKCRWLWTVIYGLSAVVFVFLNKFDIVPFLSLAITDLDLAIGLQAAARVVPLALMLAAVWNLCISSSYTARKVFLSGAIAIALLGVAMTTAFATTLRETQSWQCVLKPGDHADRSVEVKLPPDRKPEWSLLMVDGDHNLSNARFSVNGLPVSGTAETIYQFCTEKYELEDWLNQFASLARKSPDTIRKWRAVPVPVSHIQQGWNTLSVFAPKDSPLIIFGDYRTRSDGWQRMLPSASEVSPGRFFNDSDEGFDSRILQTTYSNVAPSKCVFWQADKQKEDDLSNSRGRQTGDYRIFLLLGYSHEDRTNSSNNAKQLTYTSLLSSGFSPDAAVVLHQGAGVNRIQTGVPIQCRTRTHVRVRITGKARAQDHSVFSIAGVTNDKKRFVPSIMPGTPKLFDAGPNWKSFLLIADLPSITVGGSDPNLQIELQAVKADTQLCKLQLELEAVDKPQFKGHSIRVF